MSLAPVLIIARRELRDSIKTRWFILYIAGFTVLTGSLAYLSTTFAGYGGSQGFGRIAAGLVNLVLLVVPLMGLTAGTLAITGDRERRTLGYLLAQPVSRLEVFMGKFLGLTGSLLAGLLVSFGLVGLLLAWRGISFAGGQFPAFTLLTVLLAMVTLSIGMLISTLAQRIAGALGAMIFVWLTMVFIGDLGLMGSALLARLNIRTVFVVSLLNPLQTYKVAAVALLQPALEVLGPVGLYAVDTLGAALSPVLLSVLVGWILVPLGLAFWLFKGGEAV